MSRIGLAWLLLFVLLLANGAAQAATYSFGSGGLLTPSNPPPCRGDGGQALSWSRSGSTFTCTGRVTLASGDVLQVATGLFEGLGHITVVANNGFSLNNNTVGTSSKNITLRSDWGTINAVGSNSIFGSVLSGWGEIELTGTTVRGSVAASGPVTLNGGSVTSHVSGTNGVTTNGTTITGNVSASNVINLRGGSITGNVSGDCCKITLSNGLTLIGNISLTGNDIEINDSSVTGNITTTNTVSLNNGTVHGNVQAATWHDRTISGSGNSRVYGICTPAATTPVDLCISETTLTCLDDNFNRSTLGSDWAVTSRSGSFGAPRIVSNRLRLTDNSGNVSTGATVQRLLPAKNNYIQVQFKYYAYNGNGADGVAITLSNAAHTPQPGGFGGSLGYAQGHGESGFAGGWLGIALDEYGNFSNPTEGRIGGPGARQDSVAIRGSGSGASGYAYLRGTAANLSPGIDVSGSSAGPGHTYRITVDSTVSGKAMVKVERNTGSGFTTLVDTFNALDSPGQAALPDNFYLTLTGSTGGSNNVHELDDLRVCASKMNPVSQQIDHFEIIAPSSGLTCNPVAATLRACLDATCSTFYTDPVLADVLVTQGATVTQNAGAFTGGSGAYALRAGKVGSATLSVGSSTPPAKPLSQTLCKIGSAALSTQCTLTMLESGFVVDEIPAHLSAQETQHDLLVRAVKSNPNDPLRCVPGFADAQAREVGFASDYIDPQPGQILGTPALEVNGVSVSRQSSGFTLVPLNFNAQAEAAIRLRYPDAGLLRLSMRYEEQDSGLVMVGQSNDFVVKPYGLCLETDSTCTLAGVNADCPVFRHAGDGFPLRIKAVAWQANGQSLQADQLCGNPATPNFRLNDISLSSLLVEPEDGSNPEELNPSSYAHKLGAQTEENVVMPEVGIFKLKATPASGHYFGETVGGGESGLVGRFIPAWLDVSGAASLASCDGFSYQRELVPYAVFPQLMVTGKNRQGGTTNNYDRGAFWRLPSTLPSTWWTLDGERELTAKLSFPGQDSTLTDAKDGDGQRKYEWSGDGLKYDSASLTPGADDLPFSILQRFSATALTDADGVCHMAGTGACQSYELPYEASEIRLGRLRIGNAHGSELQPLSLPWTIESWRVPGVFLAETEDVCSAPKWSEPNLSDATGELATGSLPSVSSNRSGHQGDLLLAAPQRRGSVRAGFPDVPEWLWYDWRGEGREASRGLATFGIYQGPKPLIFRRELYRGM
ncbi:DUF6701 domain-containing protein [Pseudomonas lopnurensis]|uniref:DUF6701 domain-containing protein n=1 Tax=Pseudomonas lopnurensis TaxID=1477517 RepID=UPI0028B12C8F|nr:DUF6701 domain-containing protein [Pseudomonas lopnurensis]